MKNRIILVYNPIAHGGKLAEKTKKCVLENFDSVIIHPIKPEEGNGFGNLAVVVKEINPDLIIVAGGDGTLNRYYNYAFSNNFAHVPIGIIPSGTANDFAGSINIPKDINKAVSKIKTGIERCYDILSVTSNNQTTYCVNVFSSGYLTCVSHTTNDRLKKKFGRLAYFIHGISEAIRPNKMWIKITTDNVIYNDKALLILAMNGKTAGGLFFSKTADLTDGMFDITIFKGKNVFKTLVSAINVLIGNDYSIDVIHERCKSALIENTQNRETDLDGDKGPEYPIKIECIQGCLTIMQ